MNYLTGALSFALGVLAGTGIGGGGLFVLCLTSFLGVPHLRAQWLNLVFFTSVSVTAVPYQLTVRRTDPGLLLVFTAFGVPGTLIGYAIRSALPTDVLGKIFGAMLVITGSSVLRGGKKVSQ